MAQQWEERGAAGGNGAVAHGTGEAAMDARLEEAVATARRQVEEALEGAAVFVRERPMLCLAGTVALGFVVGRLASRR